MSLLERAITALKEAATRPVLEEQELEEVFEHIRCGTPLNEKWSDAARAASAAARKSKAKGGNWRKAAVSAFTRSRQGQDIAVKSALRADKAAIAARNAMDSGMSPVLAQARRKTFSRAAAKMERITRTAEPDGRSRARWVEKNFSKGAKKVMTRVRKGAAQRWNTRGILSR